VDNAGHRWKSIVLRSSRYRREGETVHVRGDSTLEGFGRVVRVPVSGLENEQDRRGERLRVRRAQRTVGHQTRKIDFADTVLQVYRRIQRDPQKRLYRIS